MKILKQIQYYGMDLSWHLDEEGRPISVSAFSTKEGGIHGACEGTVPAAVRSCMRINALEEVK